MNHIFVGESALYYECSFSCDNAILLQMGSERFFITDSRYTIEARECVSGAEVIESPSIVKTARELMRKNSIKKVVIDPSEMSYGFYSMLSKNSGVYFQKIPNLTQKRRITKNEDEIALIRESVRLNASAFDRFAKYLPKEGIGQSERKLNFQARAFLQDFGSYELSFDPITGINQNAAKPHALPGGDVLKEGDMLLFDAGIKYKRYCSDRTRTAEVREGMEFLKEQDIKDPKRAKIYTIVKDAQQKAIEGARVGMRAREIDAIAREHIHRCGYGDLFAHSLGHGVGIDIHELPVISKRSDTVIEENMVFTIEPGIYLKGEFGVRIEDVVCMRSDGAEVL